MSIVKFAIFLNPPSLFSPNTTLSKVLQNEVNNSQHLNIGDITGGHNDMWHRLGNSAWVEPQGLGTSPVPGPRLLLSSCIPGNFSGTIPRARMGYESIAHKAEGRMCFWLRGHEVERNNCFSKIQLVGQKYRE